MLSSSSSPLTRKVGQIHRTRIIHYREHAVAEERDPLIAGRADDLALRRNIELKLAATTMDPPVEYQGHLGMVRMQLSRPATTHDFQVSFQNPDTAPVSADFELTLPEFILPVGNPPFLPPIVPGAGWDPVSRKISWSGILAAPVLSPGPFLGWSR